MRVGGIAWHILMQCHPEGDALGVSVLALCVEIMNEIFVLSSGKER